MEVISMKNKKEKSIINKREIELLNKYYEIDNENKIVTMPLHYEKASDLINGKIVSKDNYLFDYEELTSINDMIKRVPVMYKVKIDIQIDDYEDYEPEKLLAGFNDALELNQYNFVREGKWKFFKAGILLIVGITVLFFQGYGKLSGWFGSSDSASIYSEIFDIIGWVFIWECVTVAFLTGSELSVSSNMFRLRVLEVSFYDQEKLLVTENLNEAGKNWETDKRLEKASRLALLFSGVAFIALGSMNLITAFSSYHRFMSEVDFSNIGEAIIIFGIFLLIEIVIVAIEVLGGISALFRYLGKTVLRRFSNVFSIILMILLVSIIAFNISSGSYSNIAGYFVSLVVMVIYLFGYITNIIINKNKDEKNNANVDLENEEENEIKEHE